VLVRKAALALVNDPGGQEDAPQPFGVQAGLKAQASNGMQHSFLEGLPEYWLGGFLGSGSCRVGGCLWIYKVLMLCQSSARNGFRMTGSVVQFE
jgi:hypothetical protein